MEGLCAAEKEIEMKNLLITTVLATGLLTGSAPAAERLITAKVVTAIMGADCSGLTGAAWWKCRFSW